MTRIHETEALSGRIRELEEERETLNERILVLATENEALKKRLDFSRGRPGEQLIAALTGGALTRYKDRHDVTTKKGTRLEVKLSHLNTQGKSKRRRWNWDRLLGDNEVKDYDFLVLLGDKDPRYEAQYPVDLQYVCFLVPRTTVNAINGVGDCVALNTDLSTPRSAVTPVLMKCLIHSREQFREL